MVFVGNESSSVTDFVYFDDLTVSITPTQVVQYNEYYPFGLQTAESWSRVTDTENNFLFNAGSELNKSTGMYETFFRQYDPTLGRFAEVDPVADKYGSLNPYNFAFNDPAGINDPMGDEPYNENSGEGPKCDECAKWTQTMRDINNRLGVIGDDDMFPKYGSGIDWNINYSSTENKVANGDFTNLNQGTYTFGNNGRVSYDPNQVVAYEIWMDWTDADGNDLGTTFNGYRFKVEAYVKNGKVDLSNTNLKELYNKINDAYYRAMTSKTKLTNADLFDFSKVEVDSYKKWNKTFEIESEGKMINVKVTLIKPLENKSSKHDISGYFLKNASGAKNPSTWPVTKNKKYITYPFMLHMANSIGQSQASFHFYRKNATEFSNFQSYLATGDKEYLIN